MGKKMVERIMEETLGSTGLEDEPMFVPVGLKMAAMGAKVNVDSDGVLEIPVVRSANAHFEEYNGKNGDIPPGSFYNGDWSPSTPVQGEYTVTSFYPPTATLTVKSADDTQYSLSRPAKKVVWWNSPRYEVAELVPPPVPVDPSNYRACGRGSELPWKDKKAYHVFSDGKKMAYVKENGPAKSSASSPAVIMLHGNPTSSYLYRNVIPDVAQMATVYAPDLMGHGDSDSLGALPTDYTFDEHYKYIEEFVDSVVANTSSGKVFFVLHDWGGEHGMEYMKRRESEEYVVGVLFGEIVMGPASYSETFGDTSGPSNIFSERFWNLREGPVPQSPDRSIANTLPPPLMQALAGEIENGVITEYAQIFNTVMNGFVGAMLPGTYLSSFTLANHAEAIAGETTDQDAFNALPYIGRALGHSVSIFEDLLINKTMPFWKETCIGEEYQRPFIDPSSRAPIIQAPRELCMYGDVNVPDIHAFDFKSGVRHSRWKTEADIDAETPGLNGKCANSSSRVDFLLNSQRINKRWIPAAPGVLPATEGSMNNACHLDKATYKLSKRAYDMVRKGGTIAAADSTHGHIAWGLHYIAEDMPRLIAQHVIDQINELKETPALWSVNGKGSYTSTPTGIYTELESVKDAKSGETYTLYKEEGVIISSSDKPAYGTPRVRGVAVDGSMATVLC